MGDEAQIHKKKIGILLPDGVGLRNFVFTDFIKEGWKTGFEPLLWNNTPMDVKPYDKTISLPSPKPHVKTNFYKNALIQAQLTLFRKRSGDDVYNTYRFPPKMKNIKGWVKLQIQKYLQYKYGSEKGVLDLRKKMEQSERETPYYKACREQLETHRPALIFCTNQRPLTAIAPLTAAKDLGIPTVTFIFSWDNLPKATMVVDCDYYFVWSDLMKQELLFYYPHIKEKQICVTGTPQFEPHFNVDLRLPREDFFRNYGLDTSLTYICFSGDDITTSPYDEVYLEDVAETIRDLNKQDKKYGILFRRCPVDFSNRYDSVLQKYDKEITAVDPLWKQYGGSWDTTVPTPEDMRLLINCITHSAMVINLASSMVFDFATQNKPCLYLDYSLPQMPVPGWSSAKVYNFVHFRSMPEQPPVFWIRNKEEIKTRILEALTQPQSVVEAANTWFQTINQHPPQKASERIWEGINNILSND